MRFNVEVNIERDGITNEDEPLALIYYGRYEVTSWAELYVAAVKTLYIEYPETINALISKDDRRELYIRTTTINMKKPARIATIIYLETDRTPVQMVKALRQIFKRAGVLNIRMSIEIRRELKSQPANPNKIEPPSLLVESIDSTTSTESVQLPTFKSTPPDLVKTINQPKPQTFELEVPSFMKSTSIVKMTNTDRYIQKMKELVATYPESMLKLAGKHIVKRKVTMAATNYRYFRVPAEIGHGLSVELSFDAEDMEANINYYKNAVKTQV